MTRQTKRVHNHFSESAQSLAKSRCSIVDTEKTEKRKSAGVGVTVRRKKRQKKKE